MIILFLISLYTLVSYGFNYLFLKKNKDTKHFILSVTAPSDRDNLKALLFIFSPISFIFIALVWLVDYIYIKPLQWIKKILEDE